MNGAAGKPMKKENDADLAARAASGDGAAQRRVVDRLLDRISMTVRCICGGDQEADDQVQQSMIEILTSLASFRGDSSLESWAERIAVRTTMRHLKRRRWRSRIVTLDSETEGRSRAPQAERQVARHRMAARISRLMETLTPERRQVLTLRLVLGYSIEEISAITGWKINTVRDRLAVARRQLRPRIMKDPVLREFREPLVERA
jgi:RNA polymerase sigma-70 factor, ECF subfamily